MIRCQIKALPPSVTGPETITDAMVAVGLEQMAGLGSEQMVVNVYAAMRRAQIDGWLKLAGTVACPRGCHGLGSYPIMVAPRDHCYQCGWGNWPQATRRALGKYFDEKLKRRDVPVIVTISEQMWTPEKQYRDEYEPA